MIREGSFTMFSADCKYQKITHYTFQSQVHNGTDPLRDKEVKGPPQHLLLLPLFLELLKVAGLT